MQKCLRCAEAEDEAAGMTGVVDDAVSKGDDMVVFSIASRCAGVCVVGVRRGSKKTLDLASHAFLSAFFVRASVRFTKLFSRCSIGIWAVAVACCD